MEPFRVRAIEAAELAVLNGKQMVLLSMATDVFKDVRIEELMTLDSIYNIKGLNEKEIDRETKIHVAIVQSLVKRILYNEIKQAMSVTDYDLIIVEDYEKIGLSQETA